MDDSNETLKAVLRDMGIDDVDTMDESDIILLARAMGIDVPDSEAVSTSNYFDVLAQEDANEDEEGEMDSSVNVTGGQPSASDLDTAFIADNSTLDNVTSDLNDQAPSATPAADDHSHDDVISTFCAITGSNPTDAGHFLEAFGWDLEGAIPMYLENAQNTSQPSFSTGMQSGSFGGISGQRAPVHTRFGNDDDGEDGDDEEHSPMQIGHSSGRMQGIGGADNDIILPPYPTGGVGTGAMHERHVNSVLANIMRSRIGVTSDGGASDAPAVFGGMGGGIASFMAAYEDQMNDGGRQPDRYDEDGVRLPDPVQRQRLVPSSRMFRGGDEEEEFSMGRAEDPTVDWMFPPPRHLSSQASLEKARAQAQSEGRWLLVNIQSHEQFASHMLNRDTWVHETMESVLRTTYLLWQRGHTSGEGQAYMRMHRLENDDLPHIGIIDPRTGAKLLTLTGFISPDDLLIRLMEFADRNLLTVPRVATGNNTTTNSSVRGGSSLAGGTSTNASSSAVSNASSNSNSSSNIEGLASGAEAKDAKDAREAKEVKTPDYKWLPKPVGSDSKASDSVRSESKSHGAPPMPVPTSLPPAAAASVPASGQVLGVAAVESENASLKGLDFGSVPEEPAEGAPDSIKVSIKLSNGKAHARRYLKSTSVLSLFAVAAAVDDAARDKSFDLVMRYPPLSLSSCVDKTLEECNLAGSQLIIKFA